MASMNDEGAGRRDTPEVLMHGGPQAVLDAMDGVAYVVARTGTIIAVGGHALSPSGKDNSAPWLSADALVGTNLFDAIDGHDVQQAYRDLQELVFSRRRSAIAFEYRCDEPALERHMRMAITPVIVDGQIEAVLYQSQILQVLPRPYMSIFDAANRQAAATGPETVVRLCSYCHDVAWPVGDPAPTDWIAPEEYYRRGGNTEVLVSHGMCPSCYERIFEQDAL